MRASKNDRLEIVKVLVEKGVKIDLQNRWGNTALMRASDWGRLDIFQYLVENGVNINIKNNDGDTALDLAETQEIRDYLKSKGAK